MSGSWPQHELPNLRDENCTITSAASRRYNCLAWAAGEDFRVWWPDPLGVGYWPPDVARLVTTPAFMAAYGTLGFTLCFDGTLEPGIEKVALYGKGPRGAETPTHAALQLASGEWTSKLGSFEDVRHITTSAVEGPVYGVVICYLGRPRRPSL